MIRFSIVFCQFAGGDSIEWRVFAVLMWKNQLYISICYFFIEKMQIFLLHRPPDCVFSIVMERERYKRHGDWPHLPFDNEGFRDVCSRSALTQAEWGEITCTSQSTIQRWRQAMPDGASGLLAAYVAQGLEHHNRHERVPAYLVDWPFVYHLGYPRFLASIVVDRQFAPVAPCRKIVSGRDLVIQEVYDVADYGYIRAELEKAAEWLAAHKRYIADFERKPHPGPAENNAEKIEGVRHV